MGRWWCVAVVVAASLACASGPGVDDAPEPEAPRARPGQRAAAGWQVDGKPATGDRLVGAIMDLWGGDPGPICYTGDPAVAAKKVKRAFKGDDRLVSAKASGKVVAVTTRSPFGDGETATSRFEACN